MAGAGSAGLAAGLALARAGVRALVVDSRQKIGHPLRCAGLTSDTDNMAHNFNVLRFGAPCLARLRDGAIFLAFWCYEDCVSVVRWYKLSVGD